jgi:hypothetical protein
MMMMMIIVSMIFVEKHLHKKKSIYTFMDHCAGFNSASLKAPVSDSSIQKAVV